MGVSTHPSVIIVLSAILQFGLDPVTEFVVLQSKSDRTDAESERFTLCLMADHRIEDSEER